MNITPWKPRATGLDLFEDFDDIQREVNRLFDVGFPRILRKGNGASFWAPAVDIVEEKDQIRVKAELPGMKKEDIEVSAENNMLTIKGEKKEEKEIKEKDYVRSERYYGAFHRSFTLPVGIDAQKVNAAYKDGVLEILLPKKEEAKSKQTKIEVK